MKDNSINPTSGRRRFIQLAGIGAGAGILGLNHACSVKGKFTKPEVPGFEDSGPKPETEKTWIPVSDRKIRVGLVGYGVSHFGAAFGFQNHPNVEVVAVSDLFPDRCTKLAEVTGCKKTYPSLEELVKDDRIEAVFVATDAPNHKKHCIEVLNHGKHVAVAVPAVFGSLEDAEELFEAVRRSGMKYMMFETSCFRANLFAMRQIYKSGGFGKIVYAEGEYYHGPGLVPGPPLGSYKNWRDGMPAQWYPTHSNAYYVGVTDMPFTEVSCIGNPYHPDKSVNNQYNNPFRDEIALLRTKDGGIARMARTRTPGMASETGRIQGEKGSYYEEYKGYEKNLPDLERPPLPPGVPAGGHGGSHGRLTDEFITSILLDRKPLVDIAMALNLTVPGIVAHQSALKEGEWRKVPQFTYWK